ncbi:class I SAM-dependent methyltransferase [Thalassotalea aquiviva]|uniref:class I SAM-dependent methyltransferase n=1 Tax=Thalassotalea aquiviva TaxID=3242415 RepID=UPI00352B5CCF
MAEPDYLSINQKAWDMRTPTHLASKFYDVGGFLQGACTLNPIELELLGDLVNAKVLHLQCHFGLDSLSLARKGADVTGVDLSASAIKAAQQLCLKTGLAAQFIQADVIDFGKTNRQQYDLVFTSYGVLCWLPDLSAWAETIHRALKPGGQLILVEFHPFNDVLSGYDYFFRTEPDIEQEETYTENCNGAQSTVVTWPHALSEVITALINAGMQVEVFNEHKYSPYNCFEGLEQVEGKGFVKKYHGHTVPLIYSIKARKQASLW